MTKAKTINAVLPWIKIAMITAVLSIVIFGWFGLDLPFGSLLSSKPTNAGVDQFVKCDELIRKLCVTKSTYGFPLTYYRSATEHRTYDGGPTDPIKRTSVNPLGAIIDGFIGLSLVLLARESRLFKLQ